MEVIPIIYLVYMFTALYMLFFFLLIYLRNRKTMFDYPKALRKYSVSVLTPAYNEEDSIEGTIKAVLNSDYPIREMIIINDNSFDRTREIVEKLMRKYKNLRLINNKKNLGKAGSLNIGLKKTSGELVAVIDSDSFPEKDAIGKMIGFFDDKKTGAVTCSILVKDRNTFMRKLQSFEYFIIAWTRKLLGYVNGIWATPGPLAVYKLKVLQEAGGFDRNNLTEDIEITWRLVSRGYEIKMCLASKVYSIAPKKFIHWFKQRLRWDMGGIQCLNKYKGHLSSKLGYFIIPFFSLSLFLGLLGMGVFLYISIRRILLTFFFTNYSFLAGTPLLTSSNIYISASALNLFGLVVFILGLLFVIFGLRIMQESEFKIFGNIFNILFYMIVYLTAYPLILIFAIGKMIAYRITGKKLGWGTK